MKMKMKFDKKAALGMLAQYGERAVFASVVLCFLFFIYTSFTRERYDKTPQDLKDAANNANKAIDRGEPSIIKDSGDDETVVDKINRISGKISVKHYAMNTSFNPPIFKPKNKRGTPKLYTVEALRGTPGMGCFTGIGGVARGVPGRRKAGVTEAPEPMGKRWVMLTGLVDLKKQIEAYKDCFKDVVWDNPQMDQGPKYYGFWVERAEVTDSLSEENLQWKQPYKRLSTERKKCGSTSGSSSNDPYLAPNFISRPTLTFPLPKLTNREWSDEIAHPPEIPLLSFEDEATPRITTEEEEEFDEDDPDAGLGRTRRGAGMGMDGGRGMPGGVRRRSGLVGRRGMIEEELSPYVLFRFIDLNIEPGKQYYYRVRIAFLNPNFDVQPRFLIPELQQIITDDNNREPRKKEWKKYIKSDWSKLSDVVAVPRDDQLLLAQVFPPRKFDAEPKAKVMAIHWDMQNGMEVFDDFEDIRRGMVANFLDHTIKAPVNPGRPGRGMMGGPGMGMEDGMGGNMRKRPAAKKKNAKRPPKKPRNTRRKGGEDDMFGPGRGRPGLAMGDKQPEKVNFITECLVLDLRGGQRLVGRNLDLNEPGEILLLDPGGNLVIRNDVADFDQYLDHKYPPKRIARAGVRRGRDMMGPGMGMEDEMGTPGMFGP